MPTTSDLKTLQDAVADVRARLAARPNYAKLVALIEDIDDVQRRVRPALLRASKRGEYCERWSVLHNELLALRGEALYRRWHPGT